MPWFCSCHEWGGVTGCVSMRQNGPQDFEGGKVKVSGFRLDVQPYVIASSKACTGLTLPPSGIVTLIYTEFLLPAVSLPFSLMSGPWCTKKLAKRCAFLSLLWLWKSMFTILKAIKMAFLWSNIRDVKESWTVVLGGNGLVILCLVSEWWKSIKPILF